MWRGSIAPSAPDFDDLVRRKVVRDMVRSHAKNGNGALSWLLHNETQEDSRSGLPGAVMEPGANAVDDDGRGYGEPRRTTQVPKRWMMW